MNASARSIQVFGFYILLLGPIFLLIPNTFLGVFGFEQTNEPWIRVLGVVVAALGYYYIVAARSNARAFFNATVYGRIWLFFAFVAIVVLELAKPILILFGAIDLIGAIWTWKALRNETQA